MTKHRKDMAKTWQRQGKDMTKHSKEMAKT